MGWGTVMPNVFAVCMLMTSSNFVGRRTGRSSGFGAPQNLSAIDADLAIGLGQAGAIAHEPAVGRKLPDVENARQPVTGRKRNDLATTAIEERIVLHHERIDASLRKCGKTGFDFVICCRCLTMSSAAKRLGRGPRPVGAGRRLPAERGLSSRPTRRADGTIPQSSSSRLPPRSPVKKLTPVAFPGRFMLATRPERTGSWPTTNTSGTEAPAALTAKRGRIAGRDHQRKRPGEQVGGERRQQAIIAICPAILNGDTTPLQIAHFLESPAEGGGMNRGFIGRAGAEKSNQRGWLAAARGPLKALWRSFPSQR